MHLRFLLANILNLERLLQLFTHLKGACREEDLLSPAEQTEEPAKGTVPARGALDG